MKVALSRLDHGAGLKLEVARLPSGKMKAKKGKVVVGLTPELRKNEKVQ